MRYEDDDTLLGLEKAKRGQRARGGRRWTGSLGQRARASRRLPQAVFKISSYSHSAAGVWDRVNYVARDGELEVETANGEKLESLVELEHMVDDWTQDTGERTTRRVAMSAVVSFPIGTDEEQATEAARQFFREAFAENHDYIFASHTDAKQFHVHVVVQAQGHDGKQLRLNRDDIQDLRMLLAEKASEQGIELDASPRWARGLEAERQPAREVEGIERRGATPAWTPEPDAGERWTPERELERGGNLSPERRTQLEALVEERRKRDPEADACQALEYARAAAAVAGQINELASDREKVGAVKAAASLAQFGWGLTHHTTDTAEDIAEARAVIDRVDRAIHDGIDRIAGGQARREAIRARHTLSEVCLKEYRAEKREQARIEREQAREQDTGPELEP